MVMLLILGDPGMFTSQVFLWLFTDPVYSMERVLIISLLFFDEQGEGGSGKEWREGNENT